MIYCPASQEWQEVKDCPPCEMCQVIEDVKCPRCGGVIKPEDLEVLGQCSVCDCHLFDFNE
jgi:hypothetical protein